MIYMKPIGAKHCQGPLRQDPLASCLMHPLAPGNLLHPRLPSLGGNVIYFGIVGTSWLGPSLGAKDCVSTRSPPPVRFAASWLP